MIRYPSDLYDIASRYHASCGIEEDILRVVDIFSSECVDDNERDDDNVVVNVCEQGGEAWSKIRALINVVCDFPGSTAALDGVALPR